MNVPVYAAALVAFALLFLVFSAYLSYTLLLSFFAMDGVLGIQLASLRSRVATASSRPTSASEGADRWTEARKEALRDQAISAVFIAVTWGIFSELSTKPPGWIGPGLAPPGAPVPPVAPALLFGSVAAVLAAAAVTAALWYLYALRSAPFLARRLDSVLVGSPQPLKVGPGGRPDPGEACEFAEAFAYAVGPGGPALRRGEDLHSGTLLRLGVRGAGGGLTREFVLCAAHRSAFVRLDLYRRWRPDRG